MHFYLKLATCISHELGYTTRNSWLSCFLSLDVWQHVPSIELSATVISSDSIQMYPECGCGCGFTHFHSPLPPHRTPIRTPIRTRIRTRTGIRTRTRTPTHTLNLSRTRARKGMLLRCGP